MGPPLSFSWEHGILAPPWLQLRWQQEEGRFLPFLDSQMDMGVLSPTLSPN